MNSIALLGFRPRDDRYGIVRVVGRHVVAVQQILLQHTRDRHAVGEKNTKVANCSDEVLATTQSRNLAANALHFLGLCVLLERECERKKEIGEKGIVFSWLVRSAAGVGMGWQSPKAPDVETARHMINPDRLDPNETAASKSHNISSPFVQVSRTDPYRLSPNTTTTTAFILFFLFSSLSLFWLSAS